MKAWLGFAFVFLFSHLTHAEMGFYTKDQLPQGTPAAVTDAASSVFKLWVPGGDLKYKYLDWTADQLETRLKQAEDQKDYLTSSQLQFCLNAALKPCIVMDDITSGSGFLLAPGNELLTNRHVFLDYVDQWVKALREVEPTLTAAEVAARVLTMPVPLLLYNTVGTKVPVAGDKKYTFFIYGPNAPAVTSPGFFETFSTDIVHVQLPVALGPGLKLATKRANSGERLYVLGYPQATSNRKTDYGVPDSNGSDQIHWSYGPQITLADGFSRIEKLNSAIGNLWTQIQSDPELTNQWDSTVNFELADIEHGNSGGPVINAAGEVVAISSGGLKEYRGTEPSLSVAMSINLVP